jgi:outer membrane biosynthesis protein TonB
MESQTVTAKKSTKTAKSGKKTTKPSVEEPVQQMEETPVVQATPAKKTKGKKVKKTEEVQAPAPVPEPVVEEVVVQSSEEALQNASNEFDFDYQYNLLQNMMKDLREDTRERIRLIESSMKHLQKCHNVNMKNSKKKTKKPNSGANTGAKMEMAISSPVMCKFLGIEVGGMASRATAMKQFFTYAREHGLQDENDKKKYVLDATLRELFPDRTELTHQQVMGAISPYFPKKGSTTN